MNVTRFPSLALGALLAFGALHSGCTGPTFIVQQYDGPPRPSETVAIIRIHGSQTVRLITLDGDDANAPIDDDVRLHIEVLPGKHTIGVADFAAPQQPVQRISFRADPGRVYRPVFVKPAPGGPPGPLTLARMYEVGRDSDAYVRDVTLPDVPAH
jgi:hypothetical protein